MNYIKNKFGFEYKKTLGYFAKPGRSIYNHKFGGQEWHICNDSQSYCLPTTIITLNTKDPALLKVNSLNWDYIPLCSYLNCDKWIDEQYYSFDIAKKTIIFEKSGGKYTTEISEDILPNPLPEVQLKLFAMNDDDYPINEEQYWKCSDNFVGGENCFRILGTPLWLQNPQDIKCKCGNRQPIFLACLGYENWNGPFNYLIKKPFFYGEAALYFFVCPSCRRITVISQPT